MRVARLAGSSPAYLAAGILSELSRPVFIIASTGEEAARTSEELSFYTRALGAQAPSLHMPVRQILRALPQQAGARTAALGSMIQAGPDNPVTVSASIQSALMNTLPPAMLMDNMVQLSTGMQIERDELIRVMIGSGYTASPAVMEPGDFSLRGGIVDVFAPGSFEPIRVELWEDEVESIRGFDPGTQKSTRVLQQALIPPLKEVIVTRETAERASGVVREAARLLKEQRPPSTAGEDFRRDAGELFSRIERMEHFSGIESFLPAFYKESHCALDFLDKNWVVIYQEPFLCQQAFERSMAEHEDERGRELDSGGFFLEARSHFIPRSKAQELLSVPALAAAGPEQYEASGNEGGDERECGAPAAQPPQVELPGVAYELSSLKARPEDPEPLGPFLSALREFQSTGMKTMVVSPAPGKAVHLRELLQGHGIEMPVCEDPEGALLSHMQACITAGELQRGFYDPASRLAVIGEAEVFGDKIRPRRRKRPVESFIGDLSDLSEGDHVVHVDHGVGIYQGLHSLDIQWPGDWDFMSHRGRPTLRMDAAKIEYAAGSSLYVPVQSINQISKYRGPTDESPPLDTLGGTAWERLKTRVKHSIREFAQKLIRIYAARKVHPGTAFPPPDSTFREFEESFEFEETPDQLQAIDEVIEDMTDEKPMDRVVCGDVGYGKTEVALRAAFLCAMSGRQVAMLVPTTILAEQHFQTFVKRLDKYPLEVRVLSRFLSQHRQKKVVAGIGEGAVDIVIGTHRLLSKDVKFRDLGLLVIDEEHRFGVRHKERLRELRATVDTLTLTATPIPRTLYMSLSGIRDLSIIDTPPPDRLEVHTELAPSDDRIIKQALERELRRGGQAFYVHNRVQTIESAADRVKRVAPGAKVAVAHGRMPEKELEEVMRLFIQGRFDVLVCSAIIESGLDIPAVNTMIVDRADRFGLAQLYQLRGRIGRSRQRGYCFLMVPGKGLITRQAAQRLKVLKEFTELGSGFKVAAHDLEIRGAGNMLGAEQSGHMSRIGLELYMGLLENEINRLRGEPAPAEVEPEIKLPVPAYLSEDYMPDQKQRLSWYKRLSKASASREIDSLQDELIDRYGQPPESAFNLLEVARIKSRLRALGAREISFSGQEFTLTLAPSTRVNVEHVISLAMQNPDKYRVTPDNQLIKRGSAQSPSQLFPAVHELLNEIQGPDKIPA